MKHQPNPFDAVFDFSDLSPDVQTHLAKVYRLLSLVMICSVIGAAAQIQNQLMSQMAFPYIALTIAVILSIACIPREHFCLRVCLAVLFGFLQGVVIGPLVNEAIDIDPMIVRAALVLTLCVFASFSMMAMMAKKSKKWLYLGSMLNSFCLFLLFMRIFPTSFGYELSLYGGLLMFIGYVFYDTQQIIQRVERFGLQQTDSVSDAITIYVDFVAIFVRILIILIRSKQRNRRESGAVPSTKNVKLDL